MIDDVIASKMLREIEDLGDALDQIDFLSRTQLAKLLILARRYARFELARNEDIKRHGGHLYDTPAADLLRHLKVSITPELRF
jgi:hypothetical protein